MGQFAISFGKVKTEYKTGQRRLSDCADEKGTLVFFCLPTGFSFPNQKLEVDRHEKAGAAL